MPTRTARTAWTGTLQQGSGQLEMSSSRIGTFDVSFPKRAADDAGGTTSPRRAHRRRPLGVLRDAALERSRHTWRNAPDARCGSRRQPRTRPRRRIQADRHHLVVSGDVDGLDAGGFQAAAEAAKLGCPVSKALTGVDITLEVTQ